MFILIDLEATCWPKEPLTTNVSEIIEIGAVLIDDKFNIISEFDYFVKPVMHPMLSDFCKTLTSISQENVDNALEFPEIIKIIKKNISTITDIEIKNLIFGSWGFYDRRQLEKDCRRHKVTFPFKYHFSVKHEFADRRRIKPCGVVKALQLINSEFVGTHHRAIDDIRNIANIFISEWKSTGFKLKPV
jgi:inhibitor of KinA sporulation pathway (predicted exonuclease)